MQKRKSKWKASVCIALMLSSLLLSACGGEGGKGKERDQASLVDDQGTETEAGKTDSQKKETDAQTEEADSKEGEDSHTEEEDKSEGEGQGVIQMMEQGRGVAVTQLETLTEENLGTLKEAGITFVKVHVPYPYDHTGQMSNGYMTVKRAIKLIKRCGLEPVCQSFTPGGNAFNPATGRIEWMSYLPGVFEDYDDEYFYKMLTQATEFMGKDLAEYTNCWIISNEPNLNTFTGPMTDLQIVNYINTCAEGIKGGNPNSYCGVNLFGAADPVKAKTLIQLLYGADSKLDYLGLDSYFGTLVEGGAESWDAYIDTYYEMAKVPIMITEFSYSSYVYDPAQRANDSKDLTYNQPVCRDKQFLFEWGDHERNQQTQAEYAKLCVETFKDHEEVIGWTWFSNIDKDGACYECGDNYCPMESSWGLLESDGTPKPVLDVIGQ